MSSGCAAMAMADALGMPFVGMAFGGIVSSKNNFVSAQAVGQAGQGHFVAGIQSGEEGLELRLIWMIGDIAGIEHFEGKFAPFGFVQPAQGCRVKLVVEQAAFTAD